MSSSWTAATVTTPVLAVCPSAIISTVFSLNATASEYVMTVTVTSVGIGSSARNVIVLVSPSDIVADVAIMASCRGRSSSSTVSVWSAGLVMPAPPVSAPLTVRTLP